MRGRAFLLVAGVSLIAAAADAQPMVTSAGPDEVDVTIYRAPDRGPHEALELDWLNGYALISETRQVTLPAGESEVRFEGVAGGIIPQSAIVRGFPEGVVERNRDAYLLSPESLLDRSLGRRVHVRRTSQATGEVREHEAVIRSGAGGAVVLQTSEGLESLRCTGLPETLVYDEVPAGLSARPTLSVRARSGRPVTATITLSYLATGFDWQANYVATLSPGGDRVDLFAWLTLANGDETSFRDADTQAVAGRLNREPLDDEALEQNALLLNCWPEGSTSDLAFPEASVTESLQRIPGVAVDGLVARDVAEEQIVLTGTRLAAQEELGDVKLYRIPEPVTVAARSQKQVAFLEQSDVSVEFVYRYFVLPENDKDTAAAERYLVTRNRREEGLGIPLPAGGLQLFTEAGDRPILVGEGTLSDQAVGDDVEILVGGAPGVISLLAEEAQGDDWGDYLLTVTNDQATPIRYEAVFAIADDQEFRPRARLGRHHGRPLWAVTVPANGRASLRYRLVDQRD